MSLHKKRRIYSDAGWQWLLCACCKVLCPNCGEPITRILEEYTNQTQWGYDEEKHCFVEEHTTVVDDTCTVLCGLCRLPLRRKQ